MALVLVRCPMNTKNNLKNPAYFIPDPWTKTKSDNSFLSKIITSSVSDIVNENANQKFNKIFFWFNYLFFDLVSQKLHEFYLLCFFCFQKTMEKSSF